MLLRNTFDAVEKIVQYIDANYMQKITLNDLAQVSKYNRNYISQFFKSNLGVNFHDYLTRIRLREATLALGQTDQSVSEIALSHGFSDLKSFNTVFRARFSKTPTEYRRQLNETVTKYDPRFKRDFLPRADEAMNQILLQYVLDPGQPARAAACRRRYAPAARRRNVAPAQRADAGSSADRRRSGEDPVGAVTIVFSSSLPF